MVWPVERVQEDLLGDGRDVRLGIRWPPRGPRAELKAEDRVLKGSSPLLVQRKSPTFLFELVQQWMAMFADVRGPSSGGRSRRAKTRDGARGQVRGPRGGRL